MIDVLVISAEPRLVDAVRDNVEPSRAEVTTASEWTTARDQLFKKRFEIVCLDFEALSGEDVDTFITIDNVLQKEQALGVLLFREANEQTRQLEEQLSSLSVTIDMSKGRKRFDRALQRVWKEALRVESEVVDDASMSMDSIVNEEIDLPAPDGGTLENLSLARLIYTIVKRKESGVLTLSHGGVEKQFGFSTGELVDSEQLTSTADLVTAFSWSGGKYSFAPKANMSGRRVDPMELIVAGVRDHMKQRSITDGLMEHLEEYPVPTNVWEEVRGRHDFPMLDIFMEKCDGSTKFEDIIAALHSKANDGFRAAFLALETDLVFPVESAGLIGAMLTYSRSVRKARERVDEAEVKKTKAYQASSGAGRSRLSTELKSSLKEMRQQSPHEVFDVWEGCGRELVQERFYQLVKKHHPDVYGGNVSGDVKMLAQEIFILIKQSYQKLLKKEKEQTVPPPEGAGQPATDATSNTPKQQVPDRKSRPTPMYRSNVGAGQQSSDAMETIAKDDRKQTGPQRPIHETPSPPDDRSGSGNREKIDVKRKIAQLSGFKRRRDSTPGLSSLSALSDFDAAAGESDSVEMPKPEPDREARTGSRPGGATGRREEDEGSDERDAERKAKLDRLLARTKDVDSSNAPDPAKEEFNRGYPLFRDDDFDRAFEHFEKAYEMEPENGLYMTFYGFTLFKLRPDRIDESERLLRKAIESEHRQAAPDAYLFMGHILKAKGQKEKAYKHFRHALRLNPKSRDAEREVRLHEKRNNTRKKTDPGTFIKNLFKKS